jgi:chromosome segregation ATPase
MQTFVSAASAMDGHVQEVARAQERATQQSESMATALSAAAGETKTAATGLQGTTERMSEALSHATAMSSEVSEANTQWRQTQVAFMQTQGTLHDVIKALQDTARRLNDIKINVTILGLRLPFVRGKATAESN